MADLAERLVPVARALLEPGETLTGCCVATWQKIFRGGMAGIAVSPTRIVVQHLDRRFAPSGLPVSLPRDRLARAEVMNGIGGTISAPSLILDGVSITVTLSPIAGDRLRLMLMPSGGPVQREGIAALLAYLEPLLEGSA